MKTNNTQPGKTKHLRPENKDNLDRRKNEEHDYKGDDMTHNKKEIRLEKKQEKKS